MIRAMVESVLGSFGRSMLYYYEAHALVLNLVVVAYGALMLISWQNLMHIYRYLVVSVAKQIHLSPALNRKSTVKKVAGAISVPWQDAVAAARFPLVASQIAVLPVPKSVQAIRKVFDEDELIQHALDVLNGADPRRIKPSYKMMWTKEVAKKTPKP